MSDSLIDPPPKPGSSSEWSGRPLGSARRLEIQWRFSADREIVEWRFLHDDVALPSPEAHGLLPLQQQTIPVSLWSADRRVHLVHGELGLALSAEETAFFCRLQLGDEEWFEGTLATWPTP